MLAQYLQRMHGDVERYARPVPALGRMSPLEAMAQAQLAQIEVFPHTLRLGSLARRPGGKSATAAYRDVVHGGNPLAVLPFLQWLHGSGLVGGAAHQYLGEQVDLVRHLLTDGRHLVDVYGAGDDLGQAIDQRYAPSQELAVRRVLPLVPPEYHTPHLAGLVGAAGAGGLHPLLHLINHLHRVLAPEGTGEAHPLLAAYGWISPSIYRHNDARLRLVDRLGQPHPDYRPEETIPEDYHAGGM